MSDDPNRPVLLLRCGNEFEAELRASVIRGAGIEVRAVTAAASTLWHMGPALGYPYDVYVRAADVERAKEALRAAAQAGRSGEVEFEEVGEPGDAAQRELMNQPAPPEPPESLGGLTAFVLGLAAGLLTVFVPIVLAAVLKAPLSRPERTVLCALWVLFFGMAAYALRERLPGGLPAPPADERDDGTVRRHFRDSRIVLFGWFALGFAVFGPATFFFVGVLLMPVMQTLRAWTPAADVIVSTAWFALCGFWTARFAWRRQRARIEARRAAPGER